MNPPKCDDLDYINFFIAAQKVFTCTKTARCQPPAEDAPAHDAFTRLLQRQPLDKEALWQQAKAFVDLKKGLSVLDDTTLDKPYAKKMDLVTYHFSGKHQRVVKEITLQTLLKQMSLPSSPATFLSTTPLLVARRRTSISLRCLRKPKNGGLSPTM